MQRLLPKQRIQRVIRHSNAPCVLSLCFTAKTRCGRTKLGGRDRSFVKGPVTEAVLSPHSPESQASLGDTNQSLRAHKMHTLYWPTAYVAGPYTTTPVIQLSITTTAVFLESLRRNAIILIGSTRRILFYTVHQRILIYLTHIVCFIVVFLSLGRENKLQTSHLLLLL